MPPPTAGETPLDPSLPQSSVTEDPTALDRAIAARDSFAKADELAQAIKESGATMDRFEGLSPQVVADLKKRFTYHAPKPGQPELYVKLRELGLDLAILISRTVPDGREKSSAITKVEESIFWANAGIARNG